MLDILEQLVRSNDYTYLRMDGATSVGSRQRLINSFNQVQTNNHPTLCIIKAVMLEFRHFYFLVDNSGWWVGCESNWSRSCCNL